MFYKSRIARKELIQLLDTKGVDLKNKCYEKEVI